jgi:hypothetical protein
MLPKWKTPGQGVARLSYANVIASLALFVALGGTAAAAATLARDSVGSPQIRTDAVRSPEIESGAVRSSEIRDEGIKLTDLSTASRSALLGDVRVAELEDGLAVPACEDLSVCTDILTLELSSGVARSRTAEPVPPEPARNWLVQAKADALTQRTTTATKNQCGLVNTAATGARAVLDQVDAPSVGNSDGIALSAVVRKAAGNPTIALRCTARQQGDVDRVSTDLVKITAVEVGTVTGP